MVVISPIARWLRFGYRQTVNSIAFVPGVISLAFLALAWAMIVFDFSDAGKSFKSSFDFISLQDAGTARSISSAILSGIFTLAVFSFTMVMLLLSQYASQMSNRILGELIGNTFQQIVLGFYIGTIIYGLCLLSAIREIDSGIYVPALSTYFLILLTIADIFLFIYFLHYITDSIKFETIIGKLRQETKDEMVGRCLDAVSEAPPQLAHGVDCGAFKSGRFQGIDRKSMVQVCEKYDIKVALLHPVGTFLIKGSPLLRIHDCSNYNTGIEKELMLTVEIGPGQVIQQSYYYGMRQLMEIAVKALSPGINDPDTAIMCVHSLADLLATRLLKYPETVIRDKTGAVRITCEERPFDAIFDDVMLPIWHYGKNDRLVQDELLLVLPQLQAIKHSKSASHLLEQVKEAIAQRSF